MDIEMIVAAIVAALIIITIMLRLKSGVGAGGDKKGAYRDTTMDSVKQHSVPDPFTGTIDGVEYVAESLGDINLETGWEPTMTVSILVDNEMLDSIEVNARNSRPEIQDSRAAYVNKLLDMGATYLDVCYNDTDAISAEFPVSRALVDRAFAERAARELIGIKNASKYEA